MDSIKRVGDGLAAGGQPTPEDLKQLAEQGYRSVVNLRSPGEAGELANEQQQAEAVGLQYINLPLQPSSANPEVTATVLSELESLPTPVYFHCGAGGRAGALALIALATQQNWDGPTVVAKAQELNISLEQPHLQQFLVGLAP